MAHQQHAGAESPPPRSLRERAAALLRVRPDDAPTLATGDVQSLIQEFDDRLKVLELQNEQLRQAQAALAEARNRYSDLYEHAPVGYIAFDRGGTILTANRRAALLLRTDRENLAGANFAQFIEDAARDEWLVHQRQLFEQGHGRNVELPLRAGDGNRLWARLELSLDREPAAGDPEGRCVLVDVSETKAAGETLLRRNVELDRSLKDRTTQLHRNLTQVKLLGEAVANLAEGVLITGADLDWPGPRIVFVNDALCRITGYDAEELIGQSPRILQGESTARDELQRIKSELSAGRSCRAELVNYRKDGTAYDAEFFITPLNDEQGRLTNFVSIHRDVGERKRREEALRASRERFRAILDQAVAGIAQVDLTGRFILVNERLCEKLGYAEDELLRLRLEDITHADDVQRSRARVEALLAGGASDEFEERLVRKDGAIVWVSQRIHAVYSAEGRVQSIVVVSVNITKRKEVEDALRREQEFSTAIINTAQIIVLVLDPAGRIVRCNPYFERLAGWRLDDIRGRDWFSTFVPEADRERIRVVFEHALHVAPTQANANPIVTKDGRQREIEWYDAPLTGPEGELIGLLCTGRDVTDSMRAARALREREERLRTVLKTAADAIITIDERGTIVSINPATSRMFGYADDELVNRNVKLLMPSPYRDEHDGYIARYLETGEAKIIGIGREVLGRRKDGTVFPIDLAVSEVDHLGLFTAIVRDATERKAEHERLLQSERLAALGEAMTGLAHESRNALSRSQSNLRRLARRVKENDELLTLIDGAARANEDIRRQFEEVREYAAPILVRRELLQLTAIVGAAWDELSPEREARDAMLSVNNSGVDDSCEADPFVLRNAFRNLLENALAACSDPVAIDIDFADDESESGSAVRLSFRDNGPGLAPETRPRVFDAFFTTKTRGTGLGLAIVKRAVEAHGGTVTIGTGEGRGAEFIITLPRNAS